MSHFANFLAFVLILAFTKGSLSATKCTKMLATDPCTSIKNCSYVENCNGDDATCQNYYSYSNGVLKLLFSGCIAYPCPEKTNECVVKHYKDDTVMCCCIGDFCNKNEIVLPENLKLRTTRISSTTSVKKSDESKSNDPSMSNLIVFILTPTIFFTVIVIVIITLYQHHKKAKQKMRMIQSHALCTPPIQSKPVQMCEQVSRGQFGCVWKGIYEHSVVAIKVILPQEKASWETEKTMYSDYALQHENVLKFYYAEERYESNCSQFWIVTEFHENGSLADYLPNIIFDINGLIRILLSIVSGLTYIHQEDLSKNPPKPAIAHRDFKSRNLLVKSNGTCCVSDFGSACSFEDIYESDEAKAQVGTKRYMAPEVLQGAVAFQPESFLCIDIYAMALVFWECLSRCNETAAPVESYRAPYEIEVGSHPTIEEMKACVVDRHYRPILKPEWRKHKKLAVICDSIEECWDDESDARLSACCVSERLKELANRREEDEIQESNWMVDNDEDADDVNINSHERTRLVHDIHESSLEVNYQRPPEYSNLSNASYSSLGNT